MENIINFEDWVKLEMRVGKIKEIEKSKMVINCNGKDYSKKIKLNANKDDLIIIGFLGDNLIIPLINDSVIIPEKDIENGARIS